MARININETTLDRDKFDYRVVWERRIPSLEGEGWEVVEKDADPADGQTLMRRKKESDPKEPQNATEETLQRDLQTQNDARAPKAKGSK